MAVVGRYIDEDKDEEVYACNPQDDEIEDMLAEMLEARWPYDDLDTSSYDEVKNAYRRMQSAMGFCDEAELLED